MIGREDVARLLEPLKRIPGPVKLAAATLAVVLIASVGAAAVLTSNPAFFSRYRGLKREYESLQSSDHRGLNCRACHQAGQGEVTYRVALVGDFYRSMFASDRIPVYVKFGKPSRSACLTCHSTDWSVDAKRTSRIPHPAHLQVAAEKRDCVTCHKWTGHQETYMSKHRAMPFSGVCATFGCHVGWKQPQQCPACHHSLAGAPDQWKKTHPRVVREVGANSCLEKCHEAAQCRLCHTTGKTPKFSGPTAETGMKAIEVLHVRKDWIDLHGKQALLDQSKCLVCHVSIAECQNCHAQRPAFHGPQSTWIGQHKKPGKDKTRCLTCHKESWCKWCHDQFKEMR